MVSLSELIFQHGRSHHYHKSFATILSNYFLVPLCVINLNPHMVKYFLVIYVLFFISTLKVSGLKHIFRGNHLSGLIACSAGIFVFGVIFDNVPAARILTDIVYALSVIIIITYFVNPYLDSAADSISGFYKYLKLMKKPMIAFFGGYLYVVIVFTFINVSIYIINPSQFIIQHTGSHTEDIIAILLYSLSTYGIYNYNLVEPNALLSQAVYIAEALIGSAWLAIILATVIGYLQKQFDKINDINQKQSLVTNVFSLLE